jgi:hypothetical protein
MTSNTRGRFGIGSWLALWIVSSVVPVHAAPAPRYTLDFNDSVVKDARTGLTWQRTLDAGRLSWEEATAYCDNLKTLGGGSPWRLPRYKELMMLVDRSLRTGPALDRTVFPNTPAEPFWSATKYADASEGSIWFVDFAAGSGGKTASTTAYQVRCVR